MFIYFYKFSINSHSSERVCCLPIKMFLLFNSLFSLSSVIPMKVSAPLLPRGFYGAI